MRIRVAQNLKIQNKWLPCINNIRCFQKSYRVFSRSKCILNNISSFWICLTVVTFQKVKVSNPIWTKWNSMRNVGARVWQNSLLPIVHSLYNSLRGETPSQLFLRVGLLSPSSLLSLVFSRIPASANSANHFWILILPGRWITRPSAYDFIRGE